MNELKMIFSDNNLSVIEEKRNLLVASDGNGIIFYVQREGGDLYVVKVTKFGSITSLDFCESFMEAKLSVLANLPGVNNHG